MSGDVQHPNSDSPTVELLFKTGNILLIKYIVSARACHYMICWKQFNIWCTIILGKGSNNTVSFSSS